MPSQLGIWHVIWDCIMCYAVNFIEKIILLQHTVYIQEFVHMLKRLF